MTEQKPEKKVVGRTVAIALGIICIILVAGFGGAMAYCNSIINGKDNTIITITNQKNLLQTYLNGNSTLLEETQKWLNGNETLLSQTKATVNSLNSTVSNLNAIISLDKSEQLSISPNEIEESPNSYVEWASNGPLCDVNYAGFLRIHVNSSDTSTYVEVIWDNYGVNYDNRIVVGTNGTAVFPVLPLNPVYGVRIRVGNTNASSDVFVFVTELTYYY